MPVRLALVIAFLLPVSACGEGTPARTASPATSTPAVVSPTSTPCAPPASPKRNDQFCVPGVQTKAYFWSEREVVGKPRVVMSIVHVPDRPVWSPTILIGSPGQRVEIRIARNLTPNAHSFTIDEEGIDQYIPVGKGATATVTFPETGAVTFYCKFHWTLGQSGELVVQSS